MKNQGSLFSGEMYAPISEYGPNARKIFFYYNSDWHLSYIEDSFKNKIRI